MTRIAMFGNFGEGNLGNESTLQAVLYNLRHYLPDAEVTCICTDPWATMRTYNIDALPIARTIGKQRAQGRSFLLRLIRKIILGVPRELFRWLEAFFVLHDMDALIVPGTGLLTDANGLFGWGPYSLFKWSLVAKLCNCRLFFICVGAGPIYHALSRWLIRSALRLADFRSYRDTSSMKVLQTIGVATKNDRIYPDLAFSLPEIVIPKDDRRNLRRPVVGIGLMDYAGKYSTDRPSNAIYFSYLKNLAAFVEWLLGQEYDVRLLVGEVFWDKHVTEEFRDMLKECLGTYGEMRIVNEPMLSVEQLLSQIAATDLVVATRFHNVLLSFLLDKPTISISFHHKCLSLMGQMGLSQYCCDINHLNLSRLIELFCDLRNNRERLKQIIRQRVKEMRSALDVQYSLLFKDTWA